ncbi:MAG: helix-turn-helix domain-containing protein [Rhodocyclaceae bacterium]|nr:MAG: helix-turn-helix domain-containing protein [Rhodocyclaceae bacterium]TND02824.1 MAG: helix-turn-helix domain-containing protein [Rhodocyclaceae bacterium]
MVAATTPKRKTPVKKRATAKPAPKRARPTQTESGLVGQMRSMAGKVLDMGAASVGATASLKTATDIARALSRGKPMEAAADVLKAVLPGLSEPGVWAKTGAALRRMRKAAGLTITEVGTAINLRDPSLIEAWEKGRIAVPFELILRLAAVLGRNDPIGFVMKFTRSSNPDLWRSLEGLGVGKLLIQSAREREFANIYRGDDEARQLTDKEFAAVLSFTRAAFEMAMAFRGREAQQAKGHRRTQQE